MGDVRRADGFIITPVEAWYLARAVNGLDLVRDALNSPHAVALGAVILSANGDGPDAAVDRYLLHLPRGVANPLKRAIALTDWSGPAPQKDAAEPIGAPAVPTLPDLGLDLSIGEGAGGFVDRYVGYAGRIAPMTPRVFHISSALFLGSVAIARRVVLNMAFGPVYPNLVILWVAPTTLWHKSTGLGAVARVARRAMPHLLAPQDATPEALLADMAGREPVNLTSLSDAAQAAWRRERDFAAQRGWLLDEASGLLASAGKDYGAGTIEMLLRFMDCEEEYTRSTRGQGRVAVRGAYLSFLGASTPRAMAQHLVSERLWANGFWPRHAILVPDTDRPEYRVASETREPDDLVAEVKTLHEALPSASWPDPPRPTSVQLAPRVHDAWQEYAKFMQYDLLTPDLDSRLWGLYGRLPTQVLKVAILLAAFDWQGTGTLTVGLPHLARAISIVEDWRASAHRVLIATATSDFDAASQRVLRICGKHGSLGATLRDLHQAMRDKTPANIEDVLRQLLRTGDLVEAPSDAIKGPGPRTPHYRAG